MKISYDLSRHAYNGVLQSISSYWTIPYMNDNVASYIQNDADWQFDLDIKCGYPSNRVISLINKRYVRQLSIRGDLV